MAKKKSGATAEKKSTKAAKSKPAPATAKPPADPFGEVLPNAADQGSPADKNWKPKGDPTTDIATLEAQERFLYRLMVRSKAVRDLAKAQSKLVISQADETSVTDGFPVEEKIKLHKQADKADRDATKAEKDYKRAREGWNAVRGTLHRYLTEPEKPLFEQARSRSSKDKAA